MEVFERLGLAIFQAIAEGDLGLVRDWGRASVARVVGSNASVIVPKDPRESLMRFFVLRRSYFDYDALSMLQLSDESASIGVEYGMSPLAERAAAVQTMGFFEGLIGLAGARDVHAEFIESSWRGDRQTIIGFGWQSAAAANSHRPLAGARRGKRRYPHPSGGVAAARTRARREEAAMSVDLSVEFTGIRFENPFLLSSAPPTESESNILRAFEAGWGGVVTKTIGLHPVVNVAGPKTKFLRANAEAGTLSMNKGRAGALHSSWNWELISDKTLDWWAPRIRRIKQAFPDRVLIASIMAGSGSDKELDHWRTLARACQDEGADGFELNLSCPHMDREDMGSNIGKDQKLCSVVTQVVKEVAKVPVWAKLTPSTTDIVVEAGAAFRGGADAVVSSNTYPSLPLIDAETLEFEMNVDGLVSSGGLGGPAILPQSIAKMAQMTRAFPDKALLGDRRHLRLLARPQLLPPRLRHGAGLHRGHAGPRRGTDRLKTLSRGCARSWRRRATRGWRSSAGSAATAWSGIRRSAGPRTRTTRAATSRRKATPRRQRPRGRPARLSSVAESAVPERCRCRDDDGTLGSRSAGSGPGPESTGTSGTPETESV